MTASAPREKRTRTPSPVHPGVTASGCNPEPPPKRFRPPIGSDRRSSSCAQIHNVYVDCFSAIKALPKNTKTKTMNQQYPGTMSPLVGFPRLGAPGQVRQGVDRQPVAGLSATRKPGHAQIFTGLGAVHPLAGHLTQWQHCGASPWVLRTLAKGYRLQFARRPPPFTDVVYTEAKGEAAAILQQEISTLLEKRAVREVPPGRSRSGFYSRYFLVKKKGGGYVQSWTFEPSMFTSELSSSRC